MLRIVIAVALALVSCTEAAAPPAVSPSPTGTRSDRPAPSPTRTRTPTFHAFDVPAGAHPHDVAPSPDGRRIWSTAQSQGALGVLKPATGRTRHIPLGEGSAPHGVIVGPDGAPWITDGGLNAILRVDPRTDRVRRFPLPIDGYANLNTAAFDGRGILWFTGQSGYYGSVDPRTGDVRVFDAPRGFGPYGICATPDGTVWFSSLAGSYIARIDRDGDPHVVDAPTPGGGARRIWSDSRGRLWTTEWEAGKLARYDPRTRRWREWDVPGSNPMPYAVFVDDRDVVWVTDFGANALQRFEPARERFRTFRFPSAGAEVRQLLGLPGQVWGAGSGTDELILLRT